MVDQSIGVKDKRFGDMTDQNFVKAFEQANQWQKKYSDAQDIPDSEIPDELDFRNIQGYDFTGDILN